MEKKDNEILAQLRRELAELKSKVEDLDARLSSYDAGDSPADFSLEPLDIMIDDEVPFVVPSRREELASGAESIMLSAEPEAKPRRTKAKEAVEAKPSAEAKSQKVYAWHTDTPASPLSNIASGISMRDRSIFINLLFAENAQLFIDTLKALNAMESLAEAERFIALKFPQWNLGSDVVYRFMMAVRRRLA